MVGMVGARGLEVGEGGEVGLSFASPAKSLLANRDKIGLKLGEEGRSSRLFKDIFKNQERKMSSVHTSFSDLINKDTHCPKNGMSAMRVMTCSTPNINIWTPRNRCGEKVRIGRPLPRPFTGHLLMCRKRIEFRIPGNRSLHFWRSTQKHC